MSTGLLRSLRLAANHRLRRFNIAIQPTVSWDVEFEQWISEAKSLGVDPNDLGDERWASDLLDEGLEHHYLPHVSPESTVLELGPGTGRLTRHLVGACRELIVVDASRSVCEWQRHYLRGKGAHRVHQIEGALVPEVSDGSVDAVFAHGVFEHLDLDETYWFMREFHRVLHPGGKLAFNFDNALTDEGISLLGQFGGPAQRCIFRLQTPGVVERLGEVTGFSAVEVFPSPGRIAFAELTRGA